MTTAEKKYAQLVLKYYRKHIELMKIPMMMANVDSSTCQHSSDSTTSQALLECEFEPENIIEHSVENGNRSYFVRLKNGNIESGTILCSL